MAIDEFLYSARHDFSKEGLEEGSLDQDPIKLFKSWMQMAKEHNILDANAFVLSTVSAENTPSSRVVLLREIHDAQFIFYTNYNSQKGREIAENTKVALNFFWPSLHRQVRVGGSCQKISEQKSTQYFDSRPKGSKIGAWASNQSQPLSSRGQLEAEHEKISSKYANILVPRPAHWGGYAVQPDYIEFWLGRPSRLHDRILYTKKADGFHMQRLAP